MNDRLLVEAMQSRDPGVLGAVYDAYADRLYSFCWFQLRSRDAAQVALRDTLIVAEAHIGRLRDPDRFGPWLYAIARIECGRRRLPPAGQQPDIPIASHGQDDVDPRIMAWQAVMGLPQLSREILELRVRHQLSMPDLAAVFAISPKDVLETLDRARDELEAALTAEVLVHEGPYGCPGRAAILHERKGDLTSELQARLLQHARDCAECGAFRSGAVSPAKVYGLLSPAEPPSTMRLRAMSCFLDPELVSYRLFVAARLDEFDSSGFPVQQWGALVWRSPEAPAGGEGVRCQACLRVVGGTAAAVLVVGIGATVVHWAGPSPDRDGHTATTRATPSTGPRQSPREQGAEFPWPGPVPGYTEPVSATFPLGAHGSAAPPIALPSPPRDRTRLPGEPPDPVGPPQRQAAPASPPAHPPGAPPSPSPGPTDPSPAPPESSPPPAIEPTSEPTPTPEPTSEPTSEPARPADTSPAPNP